MGWIATVYWSQVAVLVFLGLVWSSVLARDEWRKVTAQAERHTPRSRLRARAWVIIVYLLTAQAAVGLLWLLLSTRLGVRIVVG